MEQINENDNGTVKRTLEANPTPQQKLRMKIESVNSHIQEMREIIIQNDVDPNKQFVDSFNLAASTAHVIATQHGWWEAEHDDGEMIALIHSELSEALAGIRLGDPASTRIPEFNTTEEELADVIILIMDTAHVRGYRVAEAILAKMKYNTNRIQEATSSN